MLMNVSLIIKMQDNQTNKRTDPDKVRMLAGWMHYSYTANRYIQKKTTKILPSGGTETLSFRRTLDYHQTTRVMTDKFFPKGKNIAGKLKDMETRLGNSKGEELPEEGFTASNYFYSSDKQVVRIYLLTKTKVQVLNYVACTSQSDIIIGIHIQWIETHTQCNMYWVIVYIHGQLHFISITLHVDGAINLKKNYIRTVSKRSLFLSWMDT